MGAFALDPPAFGGLSRQLGGGPGAFSAALEALEAAASGGFEQAGHNLMAALHIPGLPGVPGWRGGEPDSELAEYGSAAADAAA